MARFAVVLVFFLLAAATRALGACTFPPAHGPFSLPGGATLRVEQDGNNMCIQVDSPLTSTPAWLAFGPTPEVINYMFNAKLFVIRTANPLSSGTYLGASGPPRQAPSSTSTFAVYDAAYQIGLPGLRMQFSMNESITANGANQMVFGQGPNDLTSHSASTAGRSGVCVQMYSYGVNACTGACSACAVPSPTTGTTTGTPVSTTGVATGSATTTGAATGSTSATATTTGTATGNTSATATTTTTSSTSSTSGTFVNCNLQFDDCSSCIANAACEWIDNGVASACSLKTSTPNPDAKTDCGSASSSASAFQPDLLLVPLAAAASFAAQFM